MVGGNHGGGVRGNHRGGSAVIIGEGVRQSWGRVGRNHEGGLAVIILLLTSTPLIHLILKLRTSS